MLTQKRHLSRDECSFILKKQFKTEDISLFGRRGKISLLKILQVTSPLFVFRGERKIKIADAGYSWLQIALAGEYFWLTAMFDERDGFLELYVDMTDGNEVEGDDASFTDRYLDFVVNEEGVEALDQDELEYAFLKGLLSKEEYERTAREGEKVFSFLKENSDEIVRFLKREYERMKEIDNGGKEK